MKTLSDILRSFQVRVTLILVASMLAIALFSMMLYECQFGPKVQAVVLLSTTLSLLLGMIIAQRISLPIRRLVKGSREAGRDEFRRVPVEGVTEIRELTESFNDMALNLYKSQRRLNTYFYRTIYSLVRIMEARDRNTKGHSERVAEYSARLAVRLGLPPEDVELLRETAVLHDIGKLGIEERILNKAERLTETEWESIRKHPVIGEEILSPLLLNKELLAVIRSHHERYDGTGYPDRISGESIRLFAQILAVADSFDAMTSPRSYRPAMEVQRALDEIFRNRGTQFSPRVVDTFISMIREEGVSPSAVKETSNAKD